METIKEYEYKRIIKGKEVTIKVKTNQPSQRAINDFAEALIKVVQKVNERNKKREQSKLSS